MGALLWGAWGEEWAASEKVSFNGVTKLITVNAGVTSLDIGPDVYSAWKRWVQRETNSRSFLPCVRRVTTQSPVELPVRRSSLLTDGSWSMTLGL